MKPDQLESLEGRINTLYSSIADFGRKAESLKELLRIIRKPGWTTPAELTLVAGIADTMLLQVKSLADLQNVMISGSKQVGGDR